MSAALPRVAEPAPLFDEVEAGAAALARPPAAAAAWLRPVLTAYAQVLFARSPGVGALLLLATFVVPEVGATGLLGVALASGTARLLRLDPEALSSGVLGYNALLVFLMLGALAEPSPAFWAVALVLAPAVVAAHVALSTALRYHLRLPALSLPFVLVGWLALSAVPFVRGMALRTEPWTAGLPAFPGPAAADSALRSLGAIFFQPHWTAGALVLLALVLHSRIAVVHAAVGLAAALVAERLLFTFPPDFLHLYLGFNFVMTAVAFGGVFYVPGPASMGLAAVGSLACGLVSVGALRLLQPVGLPVLALPFNLVLLTGLYALTQRRADARPRPVDFAAGSPEENLHYFRTRVARFRTALPVRLRLPVRGTWVCTQGNDGEHTHRGAWRHGLDFEVADRAGRRHERDGSRNADWHCWQLPVIAPAAGTVVRVVDGRPDTEVGEVDTEQPFGNLVLLQHAPGLYSMVAHLAAGTVTAREGQVVAEGEPLGKVGASGRAPVPHLHFQVQATPTVGDPTLPIELHDLVVHDRDGRRFEARCLPREGGRVANLTRTAAVASALALPPGERLRFRVRADGAERVEEVVSEVDLWGARSLHSPARRARLWFENRGDTFVVYDHVGPRDGALFALYVALSRVPLQDGGRLRWCDRLDPRRIASSPVSWLRDALAAVLPPAHRAFAYDAQPAGERLVVRGRALDAGPGRPVVRSRAVVRGGVGIEEVRVLVGERSLEVRAER